VNPTEDDLWGLVTAFGLGGGLTTDLHVCVGGDARAYVSWHSLVPALLGYDVEEVPIYMLYIVAGLSTVGKLQNCLPGRLTLAGSLLHFGLNGVFSGAEKVDLAHQAACTRDQAKSNTQTGSCSCQPEMQRLTRFCG